MNKINENVSVFLKDNEEKSKPYSLFEQTIICKNICFYLNGEILEPEEYADMVHRIRSASQNDIVEIHLNTPGGHLDTGVQLINAIRSSQAHVITVLDSRAYSLGTLIFLSGDELQVHDNCTMMFHNFSGGTSGKGNEQAAELELILKWFSKLMKRICTPFLTNEEITHLLKGEDLWMDTDEIRKRLHRMFPGQNVKSKRIEKVIEKIDKKTATDTVPIPTKTQKKKKQKTPKTEE